MMRRCKREPVAASLATEYGGSYAFCVVDGLFYVGTKEQLKKLPVMDVKSPRCPENDVVDTRIDGYDGGEYPKQNLSCFI